MSGNIPYSQYFPYLGNNCMNNDEIIPGNKVVKMPVDLFSFSALSDGTVRNWGGMTSYVQYGQQLSPLERMLAYRFGSSDHIMQRDPMLISLFGLGNMGTQNLLLPNISGMPNLGMDGMGGMTNPMVMNANNANAYAFGQYMRMQNQINSSLKAMASTLASMENGLKQLLNDKNVPAEKKSDIQAKLDKIEELKKKFEEQLKNTQGNTLTPDVVKAMGEEVKALQEEVSKYVQELTEEIKEKAKSESTDGSDASDDTDSAVEPDGTVSDVSTDEGTSSTIDTKTGRPLALGEAPTKGQLDEICNAIDKAYAYSWGTDKQILADGVNSMNAGNVTEIITYWNKNYTNNSSGKSEFFESMLAELNDVETGQFVKPILLALKTRAEALGIYDDVAKYISEINKELNKDTMLSNSWWGGTGLDDKNLAKNIKALYNAIIAKEAKNVSDSGKVSDDKKAEDSKKKAEADAKIEEKRKETESQMKARFALDMRKAYSLSETPEIIDQLKVTTDSNGNFTGYEVKIDGYTYKAETYSDLVKKIENDNIDPKATLIKKAVKA